MWDCVHVGLTLLQWWRSERRHDSCWREAFTLLVSKFSIASAQSANALKATPNSCTSTISSNMNGPHSNEAHVLPQVHSAYQGIGCATFIHGSITHTIFHRAHTHHALQQALNIPVSSGPCNYGETFEVAWLCASMYYYWGVLLGGGHVAIVIWFLECGFVSCIVEEVIHHFHIDV